MAMEFNLSVSINLDSATRKEFLNLFSEFTKSIPFDVKVEFKKTPIHMGLIPNMENVDFGSYADLEETSKVLITAKFSTMDYNEVLRIIYIFNDFYIRLYDVYFSDGMTVDITNYSKGSFAKLVAIDNEVTHNNNFFNTEYCNRYIINDNTYGKFNKNLVRVRPEIVNIIDDI